MNSDFIVKLVNNECWEKAVFFGTWSVLPEKWRQTVTVGLYATPAQLAYTSIN